MNNLNYGSWVWRKLLKSRDLVRTFHRVEVWNGRRTSFWFDSWTKFNCLKVLLGDRGVTDMGISNDLIGAEVIARHRRRRHRVAILNETVDEIDKHKNREMQGEEQISHTSNQCLNLWDVWTV